MTYEQALNWRNKIRKIVKSPADVVIKQISRSNQYYLDVGKKNRVEKYPRVIKSKYRIPEFIERYEKITTARLSSPKSESTEGK